MEQRVFGVTGARVSSLGLGTWAMGGDEWGPSDDEQSLRVLRAAVELGVTLIDTADVYGLGHGEELIADAVPADSGVLVVTKGGWDITTDPPVVGGARRRYDRPYIEHAFEASSRRLRRLSLDVYLLHNPTCADEEDARGALALLRELQGTGRVRWVGASVGNLEDARAALELGIDVLEVPFNLVRDWARAVLAEAARGGVAVIAREPLERGLLTGKYGPDATFPEGDHRAGKGRGWLLAAQPVVERLRAVADARGVRSSDVAIAYPLSYPEVSCTIVGARSVPQLEANIRATGVALTAEERQRLEAA